MIVGALILTLIIRAIVAIQAIIVIMEMTAVMAITTIQTAMAVTSITALFRLLNHLICFVAKLSPSQPANPQLGAVIALLSQLWVTTV